MNNSETYPCDIIRIISPMEGICARPKIYCGEDSVAGIVGFLDNESGGVRCKPNRWYDFKEACLTGLDLTDMKCADLLALWKKWFNDQYDTDNYWRMVETCLDEFHDQPFNGMMKYKVEGYKHEQALCFYNHREPWDVACEIAGKKLPIAEHLDRYMQIRHG